MIFTGAGASGSGSGPHLLSAANHLEIPSNNPNLLSPDILNQRRGNFKACYSNILHLFVLLACIVFNKSLRQWLVTRQINCFTWK